MGRVTLKANVLLMLGFGPLETGSVLTLLIASCLSGGSNDFALRLIYGFLIGIRPNDSSSRKPITFTSTMKSTYGTV